MKLDILQINQRLHFFFYLRFFFIKYFPFFQQEWKKLGVDSIRYSVVDMFEAPPQEILLDGVEFINRTISKGGVVYVHCKAGRSRSAALVACYLMKVWVY